MIGLFLLVVAIGLAILGVWSFVVVARYVSQRRYRCSLEGQIEEQRTRVEELEKYVRGAENPLYEDVALKKLEQEIVKLEALLLEKDREEFEQRMELD